MSYEVKTSVDATNLICPEPIMLLHSAVRDASPGDIIEVVATDSSTLRDIAKFCEFLGHELLQQKTIDDKLIHYIKKRE